jgi:hypothetical protein
MHLQRPIHSRKRPLVFAVFLQLKNRKDFRAAGSGGLAVAEYFKNEYQNK